MKRIFYFAAMALAVCAVMVSCEKEQTTTKTNRLKAPQVTATVGETEVSVSWEAIENAVSYEWTLNDGEATSITTTSFAIPMTDLTPGDYTVSVVAYPEEGSEYQESRPGIGTFVIPEEEIEPSEGILAWEGVYTLTSTHTMKIANGEGNAVVPTYVESPCTRELTISAYPYDDSLAIVYGLSDLTLVDPDNNEFPAFAFAKLTPDNNLELKTTESEDYVLGQAQFQDGTTGDLYFFALTWNAEAEAGKELGIVSGGPTFILENNGSAINGTPYSGQLATGESFTVAATDVFARVGNDVYFMASPTDLPGGSWTLTKTSEISSAETEAVAGAMLKTELKYNVAAAMAIPMAR